MSPNELLVLVLVVGVVGAAVYFLLVNSFTIVREQTAAIVQRFGRFLRIAPPGLVLYVPFVDRVAGRVDLRVRQLDVKVETKTEENVFIEVLVSVQYHVLPGKIYEAFYKLSDADKQITAFVFDVVRAWVPRMVLDDVFVKKDDIADAIRSQLTQVMGEFGYGIDEALVTDIDVNERVKGLMNEVNVAQRECEIARIKADSDKLAHIKQVEGLAEGLALEGKGIADRRQVVFEGFRQELKDFRDDFAGDPLVQNLSVNTVLTLQYLDNLKDLGMQSKTNTILIPYSPGGMADIADQMKTALHAIEYADPPTPRNSPTA
jgi:regulator of protease activity HflC (stomatin/prohibitin superfamily)